MKKIYFIVLFSILSTALFAQTNNDNKSILWEIKGNGLSKPSYLFGTIHITNKDVFNFPDSVFAKIAKCDVTAFEINLDSSSADVIAIIEKKAKRKLLNDFFDNEEIETLKQNLDKQNIKIDNIEKKSPYEILNSIQQKRKKTKNMDVFLDAYLFKKAKFMNKSIFGLETAKDQMSIFENIKKDELKDIIETSIDSTLINQIKDYDDMVQMYINQDIEGLYNYIHKQKSKNWEDALLSKRNVKMDIKIDSLIKKSSAFICVGSAHLAGELGLIKLLKQRGYEVTPLKSPKTGYYKQFLPDEKVDNWTMYTDSVQGFRVKLPSKPSTININGVDAMSFMDISTNHFYMIVSTPNTSSPEEYAKTFIERASDKGEILNKKTFKFKNYPAFEATLKNKQGNYITRSILVGKKAYTLMIGCNVEPNKDYANRFFESISFIDSKKYNYKEYTNDTAAFKINVLSNIKMTENETSNGMIYRTFTSADENIAGIISVTYIDYEKGYYFPSTELLYDQVSKNLFESSGFTVISAIDTLVENYASKDFFIKTDHNKKGIFRYILRGNRLYILALEYSNTTNENEISTIINSFKFTPFLKPTLVKYTSAKKEFELLAPHDMEQIIEDSLAQNYNFNYQEHYVHKGGLKTNNNWIEINKYQFGNYEYLKTESDLQKYLKEYAVAEEDSLIDSAIVSSKSIKYFKFNSIFKKNKTIQKLIRAYVSGKDFYIIASIKYLNEKNDSSSTQMLNSFKILKSDKSFDILSNKKTKLLSDLKSKNDSIFTQAHDNIKKYPFEKSDISELEKASLIQYLDDTSEFHPTQIEIINTIYSLKDSSEIVNYIKSKFNSYPDSGQIRANALANLANFKSKESIQLWNELIANFRFAKNSKLYSYSLTGALAYDSIPEIKHILPTISKHIDNEKSKSIFYRISENGLTNKIISHEDIAHLKDKIIKEAQNEYIKISNSYQDTLQYYSETFYDAMSILNKLPKSADVIHLNKKIIEDTISYNKLSAFRYLIDNKEVFDKKHLDLFLKDPINRIDLYDELNNINRLDAFPVTLKKQKYFAEGDLLKIVNYDGESTATLTFVEEKKINIGQEKKRVFIYKVNFSEDESESLFGMAGPYALTDKELSTHGEFTNFSNDTFDTLSIDEHINKMLYSSEY